MALITAAQVISISFTNKNTDLLLIKAAFINRAENDYVRPMLGDDLHASVVANHTTGYNGTLYTDYLLPALAFYTKLLLLPDLNIKQSSAGLMVGNTEFGSQASSAQRAELAIATRQIADGFMKDAIKYIEFNDTEFPTYFTSTLEHGAIKNKIVGGIIFPSKRR